MANRNFSMQVYWDRMVDHWQPLLHFGGDSPGDWLAWREQALARLFELLGPFPSEVPLQSEVEYSVEDGDLIRERVVFDSEQWMSVPCQVLRPRLMTPDQSHRAILCCHGHGPYGKDPVAGIRSTRGHVAEIADHNYNFAEQMAHAGFLTVSPDLRVFGERRDGPDPFPGSDPCDVNYVKGSLLGVYTLTLNLWDMRRCLDYLQTRSEVDSDRIGMMGLSYGGTMTAFAAAIDPRIRAADVMSFVNPWRGFGIHRANFCGSQVVPGLYRWLDTDDIAGLIAPRPLLLEMGIYDDCFFIQDLLDGYRGVRRIYEAAGAGERLWADVHPGPHGFSGRKAFEFFDKYL